jgi:hypothetical protein
MSARRKPSALRWLVVAPFWAGALGAGLGLCLGGTLGVLQSDEGLRSSTVELGVILALLISTGVAVFHGYDTPPKSYPALAGRLAGSVAAAVALTVAVAVLDRRLEDHGVFQDRFTGLAVAGALLTLLALARRHRRRFVATLRGSPAGRWKAAAIAAALALAFAWTLSVRVRCALGSGHGCYRAAVRASRDGDEGLAVRFGERGCALDDVDACAMAGRGYWRGLDAWSMTEGQRDRDRAEGLLSSGCVLGSADACLSLHAIVLERRCEGYSASACRDLAQAYRTGAGVRYDQGAASRSLRQACLLGDAEACRAQ